MDLSPPPPKEIYWLFVNSANTTSAVYSTDLSDHDWLNMNMGKLMKTKLSSEIQEWFGFRPVLSTLRLWAPNEPLRLRYVKSGWIANHAPNFNPIEIATPLSQIGFSISLSLGGGEPLEEPPQGLVHLIVTAEQEERQQERQQVHDTLPDLVSRLLENYHLTVECRDIPSPSVAAKFSRHARLQATPKTVIYDGFYSINQPVDTSALPVEVYHPIFQQFMDDVATAKPSKQLIIEVQKLMRASTGVGTVELPLAKNLRSALTNILGKPMMQVAVDGVIADGVVEKPIQKYSVPLLVMEYKRGIAEGGCDPMTQASYSLLKYWQDERLADVRDRCCCPSFIIAGSGPYLSILGAVITDKFIVHRLTSGLDWLGLARSSSFEDRHVYRIAQVFDAFRKALEGLDGFYEQFGKGDLGLFDGMSHLRFYPHITKFTASASKSTEEFEYIRPLTASATSPFLARLKSSGKTIVVKFVARYGGGAHRLLANADMAPRLLYCGSTDGEHDTENPDTKDQFGLYQGSPRMVVMDYIDGTHGEALAVKPKDTYSQVKAMVDKLHESDYVFGDLRPPNIVFSAGKALLVDFDWAGKHGEAFYPMELAESITKHCEGRDLGVIEKDHDLALLVHYFYQ